MANHSQEFVSVFEKESNTAYTPWLQLSTCAYTMAALLQCGSTRVCGQWVKHQRPFQSGSQPAYASRHAHLAINAEMSKQKVVAVLYKAGKAAENKDLLGCVENELGLRKFLEDQVKHATSSLATCSRSCISCPFWLNFMHDRGTSTL